MIAKAVSFEDHLTVLSRFLTKQTANKQQEHTHPLSEAACRCERRAAVNRLVSSFVSFVFRQPLGLACLTLRYFPAGNHGQNLPSGSVRERTADRISPRGSIRGRTLPGKAPRTRPLLKVLSGREPRTEPHLEVLSGKAPQTATPLEVLSGREPRTEPHQEVPSRREPWTEPHLEVLPGRESRTVLFGREPRREHHLDRTNPARLLILPCYPW